jgi:hypothetical protein
LSTKIALETEVTTPRFAQFERRRPPCGGIVGHLRIELASEKYRLRNWTLRLIGCVDSRF